MIDTTTQTEFAAFTARGTLIKTFGDRAQALRWWDDHAVQFPDCRLDEVTTTHTVTRRSVRRPAHLRLVRNG